MGFLQLVLSLESADLPGYKVFSIITRPCPLHRFNGATELVALRTKVGGMATLQKAIVLDSLGYSDDAKKLYKQLRGHAVACGW